MLHVVVGYGMNCLNELVQGHFDGSRVFTRMAQRKNRRSEEEMKNLVLYRCRVTIL